MKPSLLALCLKLSTLALLVVNFASTAQAQDLKFEDAPELDGEYCQICNEGTCIKQRCPNTQGSPIITMESIQEDLPSVCLYTSKGWGYFKWEGNLKDGGNKFLPCDPPTYILVTPTPKGKKK